MPQRENDFQRVVTAIQRVFAPKGAKVTPSAMVQEKSGAMREIDVLVEYQSGLYPIRIAVEAKDLKRKIDLVHLDQYIGKYNSRGGISVSEIIIVAKSFTESAKRKAEFVRMQLHTIESIEADKISFFDGPPPDLPKDHKPEPSSARRNWKIYGAEGKHLAIDNEREWALLEKEHRIVRQCLHCLLNRISVPFLKKLEELRAKEANAHITGIANVEVSNFFLTNKDENLEISRLEIILPHVVELPKMLAKPIPLKVQVLPRSTFKTFGGP